ncbi:MAG TPA: sulfotransferase [Gemmatimonadales bacterium]|nr:sulfotransferase [Gemmatimonadales bacterium]
MAATQTERLPVTKPIFIIGTGRCGSTAFHRLMGVHPQVMWLSGFAQEFPTHPEWNRWAVTATGSPLVRKLFGKRLKPGENYGFWYAHAYGFAEPGRDLVAADVTPRVRRQLHSVFERMLTRRRNRVLIKLTGWSRIGFLNEVFPDARFIHIVRDGRAVASSHLHINEWQWRGWYGPSNWRYGPLSAEDQAEWEASGRSFVALAGIQWRLHTRAIETARALVDQDRYLEVRYEDYCADPWAACRRVLDFTELEHAPAFERHVKSAKILDMTARFRKDLSPEQVLMLTDLLRADLLRYGYDVSDADESDRSRATRPEQSYPLTARRSGSG